MRDVGQEVGMKSEGGKRLVAAHVDLVHVGALNAARARSTSIWRLTTPSRRPCIGIGAQRELCEKNVVIE